MKKLLCQILIIALVFSAIGFVPAFAVSAMQEAVDFVQTNGLWKASGIFSPEQAATRAETASVMANFLSDVEMEYSGEYADVSELDIYAPDIALATNLGIITGAGGNFRPNSPITRQELAVMLVRAYEAAGVEIHDTNYFTELMMDYDQIGDWAKSAVTDVLENGIMVSGLKKKFNPNGTVTRGELAEYVYDLYLRTEPYRLSYTVRDIAATDNIANDFTVIDSGLYMQVGVAGVGVIARFDGAPGEIYIRRNKGTFDNSKGNLAPAVCFARVVDPDGNVVCRVDMDYKESGLMEKIINIPEGPAGIYQIQFIGGIHLDPVSIGIKDYKSYGIRGEDYIMFTNSIPKEGYIYIPQKVDFLNIGVDGNNARFKVYSEDGTQELGKATRKDGQEILETSYSNMGYPITLNIDDTALPKDGLVKYSIQNSSGTALTGFKGRMQITGVTPVIYPNAEYARDLKSGYIMHEDKYAKLQLAGPLQKRARERMVQIYEEMLEEGNPEFTIDIADQIPTLTESQAVENAVAEAQLFSSYSHSIPGMKSKLAVQSVDPTKSMFGAIVSRPSTLPDGTTNTWTGKLLETDYPKKDWQTWTYDTMASQHAFTGALSINSELNVYYNHPVLRKRSELMMLYYVVSSPADGMYLYDGSKKSGACNNEYRTYENFMWGDQGLSESYMYVRNHFSPGTRAITDESMHLNADKLMNMRGQGPTNQLLMCMNGTIYMYRWSGEERYHENAKRQLLAISAPNAKDYYHGQSKLGYFIESGGADGNSYGRMNEGIWCSMVWTYLTLPESRQDPELKASLIETTEHYLRWDSYFYMPGNDNFSAALPNNWTSRVDEALGFHSAIVGNDYLQKLLPGAKKNWLLASINYEWDNYEKFLPTSRVKPQLGTVAAMVTNDTWAKKHISEYFQPNSATYKSKYYDAKTNANPNSYVTTNSEMYFVHHGDQHFDDSAMPVLPFETPGDNNIFLEEDGLVAIKHKGLYVLCYFNNSLPSAKMSGYSWMGGGPTAIWDDYFTTTLNPRKINNFESISYIDGKEVNRNTNYNDPRFNNKTKQGFTLDDVRHSCILGTDASGNKIVSGREPSKFSWIEQGKSFRLSGKDNTSQKTFTWNYYLTDTGVTIDGCVNEVKNGEDLYMQLPVYVQSNANYTFDAANKHITIEHNGNKIVYEWGVSSDRVSLGSASSTGKTGYKMLQIKLTAATPYATVKVTRTLAN